MTRATARAGAPAAIVATTLAVAACGGSAPSAFDGGGLAPRSRVAVLPLVNYTEDRNAPERLGPMIVVELWERGVVVVDAGVVEEALADEPWLLLDRTPPDILDRIGERTGAHALLVGSVLTYGYRDAADGPVPEVSLTLKLLEVPGGRCLWSAVHSRDGTDREKIFGLGRVGGLERLADSAIAEIVATLPLTGAPRPPAPDPDASPRKEAKT